MTQRHRRSTPGWFIVVTVSVLLAHAVSNASPLPSAARRVDLIFADGFESGDITAWSNGKIAVTADQPLIVSEDGLTTASFSIRLASVPSSDVVIEMSVTDPTEGSVSPASITLSTTNPETITVSGLDDSEVDGDRTFFVELTVTSGDPVFHGFVLQPLAVINQDDELPQVAFAVASIAIREDASAVDVEVRVWPVPAQDVTVAWTTIPGSATLGDDYDAATSSPLLIPAHSPTGVVTFDIAADALVEPPETFEVALTGATGATIGSPANVTVQIDDPGYPLPRIGEPTGRIYGSLGEVLTMDGAGSIVPPGYETWLAALVDGTTPPLAEVSVATGLTGAFQTSATDDAYRVRLVIATPAALQSVDLHGTDLPCTASPEDSTCDSLDIVVSRESTDLYPIRPGYVFPDALQLLWNSLDASVVLERSEDGGDTWLPIPNANDPDGDGFINAGFADRDVQINVKT